MEMDLRRGREKGKREFSGVVNEYSKMMVYTYSAFGLRADSDFMIWRITGIC